MDTREGAMNSWCLRFVAWENPGVLLHFKSPRRKCLCTRKLRLYRLAPLGAMISPGSTGREHSEHVLGLERGKIGCDRRKGLLISHNQRNARTPEATHVGLGKG